MVVLVGPSHEAHHDRFHAKSAPLSTCPTCFPSMREDTTATEGGARASGEAAPESSSTTSSRRTPYAPRSAIAVLGEVRRRLDDGNNVSDQKRLPDHSSSAKLGSSAHVISRVRPKSQNHQLDDVAIRSIPRPRRHERQRERKTLWVTTRATCLAPATARRAPRDPPVASRVVVSASRRAILGRLWTAPRRMAAGNERGAFS